MKNFIICLGLVLSLPFLVAGPAQQALLSVKTPAGGGGGAAWDENGTYAATDSTDTIDPDLSRGGAIVASQSGTCTKLSFGLNGWSSSFSVKIALFNGSGVPIATETVTIGSDPGNGRYEITLTTPVAVTSGVTYIVNVVASTSQSVLRYLASQPSGSGKYAGTTYAGFPGNPTTHSDHPSKWNVGMYIVP